MLPARHPVPPPGEDEITLSRWGRWPSSPSLPAFLVAHLDPDGPSQCTSFQALEVPAAVNNNGPAVALTPDRDCIHLHRAQRNRRRPTSPCTTRNSQLHHTEGTSGCSSVENNQSSPPLRSGLGAPLAALPPPGCGRSSRIPPPSLRCGFLSLARERHGARGSSAMICSFSGSR